MRKKPNLQPRMERCAHILETAPEQLRGHWAELFPGTELLALEIGCGKGRFTVETARQEPKTGLVAIERVPDAIVVAMERACAMELGNLRFIDCDAKRLTELFAPEEVSRIYLNFSDPWPKSRDAKHRLTAPGFLRLYARLLPIGGEIRFKTDNHPLFVWSVAQMQAEGWRLEALTEDLHENGPVGVMTDYEEKFHAQGVKINRVVAVRTAETICTGEPARLRNASLSDARGMQNREEEICG